MENDITNNISNDNKNWKIKSGKTDLFWAILGTALNVLMGVIVLPIMLMKLTDLDMGVWYVLAAIQSFIYLLDLGFSPTFTRNVTYAYSGISEISKDSIVTKNMLSGKPNFELLFSIYFIGKKVYRILSIVAIVILCTGGLAYYYSILPNQNINYYITYSVFAVAMFINIYYTYVPAYMKGVGAVKESYQAYVISRLAYILIAFTLLLLNVGLLGVVIALLVSGFLLRICSGILLKKYYKRCNITLYPNFEKYSLKSVFTPMMHNTKKEALVTISNFVTSQMATFFCTSYFGLSISSKYGLTLQLLNLLSSLCFVYYSMVMPQIAQARVDDNKSTQKRLFSKSYAFMFLGFIVGLIVIVFLAPPIISLIKSNTSMLPQYLIMIFGINLFLEKTFQICCSFISTSNKLPYTYPYIISSCMILILYAVLPKIFSSGVILFAISSIAVQLCFNAWYWQVYVSKELSLNPIRFISCGIKYWYRDLFKKGDCKE